MLLQFIALVKLLASILCWQLLGASNAAKPTRYTKLNSSSCEYGTNSDDDDYKPMETDSDLLLLSKARCCTCQANAFSNNDSESLIDDDNDNNCIDKQGDTVSHALLPSTKSPIRNCYLFSDNDSMSCALHYLLQAIHKETELLLSFASTIWSWCH
jgi:hypothetical protein